MFIFARLPQLPNLDHWVVFLGHVADFTQSCVQSRSYQVGAAWRGRRGRLHWLFNLMFCAGSLLWKLKILKKLNSLKEFKENKDVKEIKFWKLKM